MDIICRHSFVCLCSLDCLLHFINDIFWNPSGIYIYATSLSALNSFFQYLTYSLLISSSPFIHLAVSISNSLFLYSSILKIWSFFRSSSFIYLVNLENYFRDLWACLLSFVKASLLQFFMKFSLPSSLFSSFI